MKEEVHLQDFLILEAIRVFYPSVYEDMIANPWIYLPPWGETAFIIFPLEFRTKNEKKYSLIKEHIENLVKDQKKGEVLLKLLQILFIELENAFSRSPIGHDGLELEYRRQKRLSHPEVFWKYFTLSVPTKELPDHTIESLIDRWNGLDHGELKEDFKPQIAKYSQRKQLTELFKKLILFMPNIEHMASRELIEYLYQNTRLFRKEGKTLFQDSEYSAANHLLFHLIDKNLPLEEIGAVLFDLVQVTPSFELAIRLVAYVRERSGDLLNIHRQGNFDVLRTLLGERLTEYFINGNRNIFDEEESYGLIMAQWGTYSPQDNLKVNDYVFRLVEEDHTVIGRLLVVYMSNIGDLIRFSFRREDFAKLYDENKLYELAKHYLDSSYSSQDEKKAVEIFISQYEERRQAAALTITQQSNKQKFMNANNQGLQLFKNGEYVLALEEFNRALDITNWNDEFNWVPQVRMEKWRTLLELAIKSEGENRNQYFSAAQKIASNEAEIRDLFNVAFPSGADQAPQELYCCIFYYLQWDVAPAEKKDAIKSNFEKHFSIATSQGTSGHSHEIMTRCGELAAKIRQ